MNLQNFKQCLVVGKSTSGLVVHSELRVGMYAVLVMAEAKLVKVDEAQVCQVMAMAAERI